MYKKKRYFLILLISLFSIVLIGYSLLIEIREKPYDDYIFTVSIQVDNKEIVVYPYQKYNNYYFLLPSFAKDNNTYIVKNKKHDISLNDIKLSNKTKVSDFKENIQYSILNDGKDAGTLTIMYGSEIPTIHIDTDKGDIDINKNNKHLQEPASIMVVDNNHVDYSNSIEFITGRGNHSWEFEKKGWSIKLLEETSLLGMKSSDKWILTSNAYDDTLGLRNYIAYNMAKTLGMEGTSDFRFVDVYINKMYQGTYILFERIEENKEKFNIGDLDLLNDKANKTIELNKLKPIQEFNKEGFACKSYKEFNSPKDISGGYIIERNVIYKTEDKEHLFSTKNNETFVVRYPSFVNKEELEYIENIVEQIDRAFHAEDYVDPISHKKLNELIDMDSFVLKYLVDEVTKNEGAGATSAYYYKKQGDDKLYAGPIWDYDKSLGRHGDFVFPEGLSNGVLYSAGIPSDWFERLYNNEEANILIKKYYKEKIKPFLLSLNNNLIDAHINNIRSSFEINNVVWGEEFNKEDYVLPYDLSGHVGDLDYSVNYIKWWLDEREKFLDNEWGMND